MSVSQSQRIRIGGQTGGVLPPQQRRLRWVVAWALSAVAGIPLLAQVPGPPQASSNPAQRRQFFDGLVRGLVDTRPESPGGDPTRTLGPLPSSAGQLERMRSLSFNFAQDASRLTDELYAQQRALPELRALLNDILRIRATATVLSNNARQTNSAATLAPTLQDLDEQWRLFAGKLLQVTGLSQSARQRAQRLSEYDQLMLDTLGIKPQLDHTELIRQTAALGAAITHLIDDIEIEIEPSTQRQQLLLDGRRVLEQIRYVSRIAEQTVGSQMLVDEYQRFRQGWYNFAARLRQYDNRYIDRSSRRIERLDRDIRELLWISDTIDQPQILSLSMGLHQDVEDLLDKVTLRNLLDFADGPQLLQNATTLRDRCQHLISVFDGDTSRDEIVTAFRSVVAAWAPVNSRLDSTSLPQARNTLKEIQETIGTLEATLGVRQAFDRERSVQVAATLENLSDHMHFEVNNYVIRQRQRNAPVPANLMERASALREDSHLLHRAVATSDDSRYLKQHSQRIVHTWNQLHGSLSQIIPAERQQIQRLAAQITPLLVEIQTTFEL